MNIFGTIQPKPRYRTPAGHFRTETNREFRDRHDDAAWADHLQRQRIIWLFSQSSPWEDLLSGKILSAG